jgi:hypothetical protein
MADTEYSALTAATSMAATDGLALVRGGVPYRYTGPLPAITTGGNFTFDAAAAATEATPATYGLNLSVASAVGLSLGVGSSSAYLQSWGGKALRINPQGNNTLINPASGNVLVGLSADTGNAARLAVRNSDNDQYDTATLELQRQDGGTTMLVFNGGSAGFSFAGAVMFLSKNTTTNRSINAAGTVNVSGADYAEYMTKAPGCGEIAKGDVCGVDRAAQLTRSWAAAISFVVKSTEPGYRGGDTWGIGLEGDELEQARQRVDTIAFSGQVPVNVDADTLAACEAALAEGVGIYLVAAANGGGIKAVAVLEADMTLPLYMRRLGKVWAIRDARPIIDVQHG